MMRSLVLTCMIFGTGAASAQSMTMDMEHDPQMHGMAHGVGAPAAQTVGAGIAYPVQQVQEPEALDLRTGEDLPVPELLGGLAGKPAMSLANWLNLAEGHQPTLVQARAEVQRSEQQARQLALPPNPVIGYSGEHIRGGSYHGGDEGAFLSQEIVLGRKLALRRDVARAEGRANEQGLEMQRARVHNDVAQRFFDALAAQMSVTVQDRALKLAEDAQTNAHELMRVGQADAGDVLKAEIAAEEAKIDFAESQRAFLAAFGRLAATAGQPDTAPQPLEGKLTEPPQMDAAAAVSTDLAESPAIKQAQALVAVAEAKVNSAKRESLPNLNLTAGEWYSGERLEGLNKATGWMGFAQAGVQIPLWNRNQGNVGAARVELSSAQSNVLRTQLSTRERAEPIAQQYEQARFTAERYRTQMLPRARRAYELEVMKYQQMAQPYAKALEAEAMLYQLQMGYIRALHQEWQAAIALENFTLDGALEKPVATGSNDPMQNLPQGN